MLVGLCEIHFIERYNAVKFFIELFKQIIGNKQNIQEADYAISTKDYSLLAVVEKIVL